MITRHPESYVHSIRKQGSAGALKGVNCIDAHDRGFFHPLRAGGYTVRVGSPR